MIKYSNNLSESLHLIKGYATNPLKVTDSQESGSQCVFIKQSSYISGKNTQFWKLNLRENKSQGEKNQQTIFSLDVIELSILGTIAGPFSWS